MPLYPSTSTPRALQILSYGQGWQFTPQEWWSSPAVSGAESNHHGTIPYTRLDSVVDARDRITERKRGGAQKGRNIKIQQLHKTAVQKYDLNAVRSGTFQGLKEREHFRLSEEFSKRAAEARFRAAHSKRQPFVEDKRYRDTYTIASQPIQDRTTWCMSTSTLPLP